MARRVTVPQQRFELPQAVWCHLLAVLALVALLAGSPASAQFNLPGLVQESVNQPPPGVRRLGDIEVAPVTFEGRELLRVASPTVRDRKAPGNRLPVELRASLVEANLERLVQPRFTGNEPASGLPELITEYDPRTLSIYSSVLNGEVVILAADAYHSRPLRLITVTDQDADYYGLTLDDLTRRWLTILRPTMLQALEERLPANTGQQALRIIGVLLAVAALSFVLWFAQRLVRERDQLLEARQIEARAESTSAGEQVAQNGQEHQRGLFVDALRRTFSLQNRRSLLSVVAWLLLWAQILTWILGLSFALSISPWTRELARQVVRIPFWLLVIWFAAGLFNRIGDVLIERIATAWESNGIDFFSFEDAQRKSMRITTTVRAAKGLKTFLIYTLALTLVLSSLGFTLGSVLTIGGIVAIAVSFGLQSIVKDLVNGFLILWEDQYAIGDVIAVGPLSGFVENLNLRVTQLRNSEGRLITLPNSTISQVENLTRSWSRVDFAIEIAYDADIRRALAVLREVAEKMYAEPEWHEHIPEPPEVLGVDNLAHTGMLIRVWIKTRPLQQWAVSREFRLRVRLALEAAGIAIGRPQQLLQLREAVAESINGHEAHGSVQK